MKCKRIILVLIATFIFSGCKQQWEAVNDANKVVSQSGAQVTLPVGWVSIEVNKKLAVASNDGPSLNFVKIETFAFTDIQKVLKTGIETDIDMLEASKKYLALWSKNNNITDFDIVNEDYVEIGGKGHYQVEWTFKDENGTTIRNMAQGTVKDSNIINIAYQAPNIHYFEKHHGQVKEIFASVNYI